MTVTIPTAVPVECWLYTGVVVFYVVGLFVVRKWGPTVKDVGMEPYDNVEYFVAGFLRFLMWVGFPVLCVLYCSVVVLRVVLFRWEDR